MGYIAVFFSSAKVNFEVAMRDVDIANHFINAAAATLYTMAGLTVTPGKFFVKQDNKAMGEITAIIGVSGHRLGTIAVSFSRESAIALVHGMLGDDVEDLEQDIRDAVGEITNMISGQARAGIAESGVALQASTPTVVVGDDVEIEHKTSAPVIVIPFTMPDGEFAVEFCLGEY
jgi:chemotaxis protein CheX